MGFIAALCLLLVSVAGGCTHSPKIVAIIDRAHQDGIDLPSLPFAEAAFKSIDDISWANITGSNFENATRVDTHVHAIPDFYHALVPSTGGNPTPAWDVATHLHFMANKSISHAVLSISTPGSNVFLGDQVLTVGLARLLNEWLAELVKSFPERFSFFAVAPLPYVSEAITEVNYASAVIPNPRRKK